MKSLRLPVNWTIQSGKEPSSKEELIRQLIEWGKSWNRGVVRLSCFSSFLLSLRLMWSNQKAETEEENKQLRQTCDHSPHKAVPLRLHAQLHHHSSSEEDVAAVRQENTGQLFSYSFCYLIDPWKRSFSNSGLHMCIIKKMVDHATSFKIILQDFSISQACHRSHLSYIPVENGKNFGDCCDGLPYSLD